ncbi:hypothetical protein SAMN05216559_2182 [Halomicrobium zhouii]|uniref:Uncharacterized protein n=1 Tax=Halomicrobium zhouii TaxID=767519 RepID=A0A1I6L799_9EURY|nr:hypothetical protein [Halomicrobium zhouii]SFR99282.1 hypothetical protein SAMN05216559_2182 [Halomicrobium zhouii]
MSVRERTVGFLRQRVLTPMALGVIILSLTLTAAFLGLVGLISGADLNVIARLPAYSLVMGIVFVVAILRLDSPNRDGMMVLVSTSGIAVLAFVLVGLATEGVMYTYNSPEEVVMSNLIFYFAAAGMVCTGVVFWALHHWREFATNDSRL